MKHQHKGFILLTVVLTLTILSTLSLMLSRQSAINAGGVVKENQPNAARYAAEAGYNHALWQLNQQNCSGYADIPATSFGNHSYTVTITDAAGTPLTAGSPAKVSATGSLVDGISRSLIRENVKIYQTSLSALMQPGAASGKDAEIWAQSPNNNYGDGGETWVSSASNDTTRSLLLFNMDTIPQGAKIITATLSLLRQSGSGSDQPVSAHRITNSWSEDVVTWNKRETGTNWNTAGTDFDNIVVATTPVGPVNQRYEWNITPLAQGWVDGIYPNYGVVLVAAIAGMPGERFYTSDDSTSTRHPSLTINYACECGKTCSTTPTDKIILSTTTAATLASLNFELTDLAEYDPVSNAATLYFDGSTTSLTSDIDALHILENNNHIFSTKDNVTLSGLGFKDGDLVEYNPTLNIARLFFDESKFSADEDIKSVFIMDNGHILLSTATNASLGGLSFTSNDLVEYDLNTDTATLYFDGSSVSFSDEIDAVHVLDNNHIVLSTQLDASLGGLNFKDGDLIDYNLVTDSATLYFDESLFVDDEDVQSAHIGDGSGTGLPAAKKLYWTDDIAEIIQRSNENGSNIETVVSGQLKVRGLDIDTINGKIYWTNDDFIKRADLDGSNIETIFTTGTKLNFDVKLDVTGGKMYWTYDNLDNEVMRANLDGSSVETLNTSTNRPMYFSLDATNGFIYVTEYGNNSVSRMNLDGSSVTTIVAGSGSGNIGSAIDTVNGKIYWTGGTSNDWIKRANLDGSNVETILTSQNSPQDITYDADNDRIYWTDAVDFVVRRANSDGSNVETILSGLTRPRGIVLVNASDVPVTSGGPSPLVGSCNGNFLDQFNIISFGNSDGTLAWTTDWLEIGESDGPTAGDIRVRTDQNNYQLRTRDNDNSGEGVEREANLSGAGSATLSYDYRRMNLDNSGDYTAVEISANGTAGPWTELTRHQGSTNDGSYVSVTPHDISSYISANTRIRFKTSSTMGGTDTVWFDNIEIQCSP